METPPPAGTACLWAGGEQPAQPPGFTRGRSQRPLGWWQIRLRAWLVGRLWLDLSSICLQHQRNYCCGLRFSQQTVIIPETSFLPFFDNWSAKKNVGEGAGKQKLWKQQERDTCLFLFSYSNSFLSFFYSQMNHRLFFPKGQCQGLAPWSCPATHLKLIGHILSVHLCPVAS